jgi:RES domain-containing protein
MNVYRLSKEKYRNDLSGKGAELAGGRWNSKGRPMVYSSESISLCTAEAAVHLPLILIPRDYYLITIDIPDMLPVDEVQLSDLSPNWRWEPPASFTQVRGDRFLPDANFCILKVPSAVIPADHNYLLNPAHKDFSKISIAFTEPYVFDDRLFVR